MFSRLSQLFGQPVLGILLGAEETIAVETAEQGGKRAVLHAISARSEERLFEGHRENPAAITAILDKVIREFPDRRGVIQVALPSAAARFFSIPIESKVSGKECETLVQWHLNRLGEMPEQFRISFQQVNPKTPERRLYGVAIRESLLQVVESALAASRRDLTVIDTDSAFRWNALPAEWRREPAALLEIRSSHWSLQAWDGRGLPVLVKPRWRTVPGAYRDVAADCFRFLAAHSSGTESTPASLYLAAGEEAEQAIRQCLEDMSISLPVRSAAHSYQFNVPKRYDFVESNDGHLALATSWPR